MKYLFLIPLSYPYSIAAENTFLQHEVYFLSRYFDRVIIFPETTKGDREYLESSNLSIDISFAKFLEKKNVNIFKKIINIFNLSFYKEIIFSHEPLRFDKIKKILSFLAVANEIKNWFLEYLVEQGFIYQNILMYTYWTTSTTLGLGYLTKKRRNIKLISRTHGIDLYEERGSVVCRRETLKYIDEIHTVSLAGKNYLIERYSMCKDKVKFSPLGVKIANNINQVTDNKKFVIVSCSQIIALKRVHLIANALEILSKEPKLKIGRILWYHFGNGDLFEELKYVVKDINNENVEVNLWGYVNNDKIMEFYTEEQVNLFITTTSSEGGRPVSIQEALSFGIPILATKVGGIPEIVDDSVGKLLSENPTPSEIANEILFFISNPDLVKQMRVNALKKWETELNAEKNFETFAKNISKLI